MQAFLEDQTKVMKMSNETYFHLNRLVNKYDVIIALKILTTSMKASSSLSVLQFVFQLVRFV